MQSEAAVSSEHTCEDKNRSAQVESRRLAAWPPEPASRRLTQCPETEADLGTDANTASSFGERQLDMSDIQGLAEPELSAALLRAYERAEARWRPPPKGKVALSCPVLPCPVLP